MQKGWFYSMLLLPQFISGQVSFQAVCDAESVLQGSTFQITFQLKNAEGSGFQPPGFSPCQVVSGPSRSMQTTIINGTMSSSIGFVYVIVCNQPGTVTIPPARINVRGTTLQTKPLTIKVVKAIPSKTKGADILIKAVVDKSEVYLGEQFSLTYKLCTRVNIDNIEIASRPNLDAFQDEAVNVLNNPLQREIHENKEYNCKVLSKTVLYPVKTGACTIDPATFRVLRGDDNAWGMPSLFRSQVENISTNEIQLVVKDLPEPIPQNFSGAVGEMYFQVNPVQQNFTLNDAIYLGIQLRGDANFNLIKSDFITLDSSFEISDSKISDLVKVTDEPKITKTRKYDYLIVPKSTGHFVLKPEFVYFNTQLKKYVVLADSFPLHIKQGNVNALRQNAGNDFADIMRNPDFEYETKTLIKDFKTWLLFCLPLGIFIYGKFKKEIQELFASKPRQMNTIHEIPAEQLTPDNIEEKLIFAFHRRFPLHPDLQTLASIKQCLLQSNVTDTGKELLAMIQLIEAMKYSGRYAISNLQELNMRIDHLLKT